ncbi:MAG: hypothetical protein KDJ65_14780 [Anaerolineae bacterium]|nr:hypothetical protein [Anaerolineae bacterium]
MNYDEEYTQPQNLSLKKEYHSGLEQSEGFPFNQPDSYAIKTGDINGSFNAIGHGAQVIVERALTAVEEAEQRHQVETQILLQAVINYVERLKAQIPPPGIATPHSEPYKSLLSYRVTDAPFFFGRDKAKRDLLNNITSRGRLTVLHAESGAGKTSLLQAGLAAELLAKGHFPLYVRAWRRTPTHAIKQALLPDLERTPDLAELPLRPFLSRVTDILGLSTIVYILLDQFEEFFSRLSDDPQRQAFVEELGDCIEDEILQARFVLSIRKDYFANLSEFRGRIPYIFVNEYALKLFTPDEAADAVIKPAGMVDLNYGSGVVDQILDELQTYEQKIILPAQLQLVCWALYRELGDKQQQITLDMLRKMGGVAGILRNYLHSVLTKEIPPRYQEQARRVIEALVRADRSRDIQTAAQLSREIDHPDSLSLVLDSLISSRLLRVVEAGSETETAYELAHDYLVEQIELDPEVLARKAAQELLDQEVAAWQQNPKLLIGEEKLKVIQAQEAKLYFSPEAKELYDQSKKARRRQRAIFRGLFGSVLLAIVALFLLYQSLSDTRVNLQSAKIEAAEAVRQEATAVSNQAKAETAAKEAVATVTAAGFAQATAEFAQNAAKSAQATAESQREQAEVAKETAEAAKGAAETAEAMAEMAKRDAENRQAVAEEAAQQAITARQTAEASQATADAGRQLAVYAEQTAQAEQRLAEQAASDAQAAAAAAQQAKAAAEEAQREAEVEAEQARKEKTVAEQAAQYAEATRVAVELLRDQAQMELIETQRIAAITRDTQDCSVGKNPGALAYDGFHIWVINKLDKTVTKLQATDCTHLGTFTTGGGPSDIVYGGGFIWLANRSDNTIQKISISNGATVATFPAGPTNSQPTSLLYENNVLWVASDVTNKLRKIDPNKGTNLGTYDIGSSPTDIVSAGGYIWVANFTNNQVSRFDANNGNLRGVFEVGLRPIWIMHAGSNIWVANRGSDTLSKLRASDGVLVGTFNTGGLPDALAFDDTDIWVANHFDHNIIRLQPNDGTPLSTVSTGKTPTALLFDGANIWVAAEDDDIVQKIPISINLTGKEPLAITYDGLYMWVANYGDNTVSKMLASTGQQITSYSVGSRPVDLVHVKDSIWVINQGDNNVSKLDIDNGTILGTFSVGDAPSSLVYDGTYIWVANKKSNNVTRIREVDGKNSGTFQVGNQPVDILYDGSHIWVANAGNQTLEKLHADGSVATDFKLGIPPHSFLFDGNYFWVAYTVDAIPAPPETRLLQLRAADGRILSDTSTGITGAPATAPAAIAYDGHYIWVSSPNTIGDSIVIRFDAVSPGNLVPFPVCDGPSALLEAGKVWVACQADNMIQKLPDSTGLYIPFTKRRQFEQSPGRYLPFINK